MAIVSGDIHYRLSGGAANSDPLLSLGGAKSSNQAGATIFDDVSGDESAAGDVEYRCLYIHNNHGSLTLQSAVAWIQTNTPSPGTTIDIGLGSAALNAQEQGPLANENTAPSGISWSAAATKGGGVSLGSIPFGQHQSIWIRRTTTAGAAAFADSFTLRVEGDTAP